MAFPIQHSRRRAFRKDPRNAALLHFNGADGAVVFTDSSQYAHAFTAYGNAQIDTAQYQFGGASGLAPAADGNYVLADATSPLFDLGSSFTVEFWVRSAAFSTSSTKRIWAVGKWVASTTFWTFMLYHQNTYDAGKWEAYINDRIGGTNGLYVSSPQFTLADNIWYHVALIRSGTTWTITIDGVSVGALTFATGDTSYAFDTTAGKLKVWEREALGDHLEFWMDEFRLSTIARYTSFPFTPPAAEFSP